MSTEYPDLQITGLAVGAQGMEIGYTRIPRDLRKNGLAWNHAVQIPFGSDYDDELDAVMQAVDALLRDVLEDEATAEPIDLPDEDEEDGEEQ